MNYELISFQLTDAYVAWFEDDGEDVSVPCVAIGLAKQRAWDGEDFQETCLVGVMLIEGYFHIANEDSDFIGILKVGQQWEAGE